MSEGSIAHREKAADTAAELLGTMNASKAPHEIRADGAEVPSSVEESPPLETVPSGSEDRDVKSIPKVSLGPISKGQHAKNLSTGTVTYLDQPHDLDFLRREMNTQERIIATLQVDNEALLREKKETTARYKELEEKYEHLEAKHSLLLSAQQDLGSRSNLRLTNDAAKISQLQARVQELQSALDAEKLKSSASSFPGLVARLPAIDQTPAGASAYVNEGSFDRTLERATATPESLSGGEHASRLREYERAHALHKATIDTLHTEVGRLENEKRSLEERLRSSARQVEELTGRTRDLEHAVAQKKESIGELLRSCQGSATNAQRLKKQEARIRSLEAALAEKDDFTEKAMERLRRETKEVCERYQKTIAALQSRPEPETEDSALQRRFDLLEKENAELRHALASKNDPPTQNSSSALPTAEGIPTGEKDAKIVPSEGRSTDSVAPLPKADLQRLEAQLSEVVAESARYKELSSMLQAELVDIRSEWDTRLQEVKRSFASQLQLVRSKHNEEIDRLEAGHRSELLTLSHRKREDDAEGFSAKLISIMERRGFDSSLLAICERLNYLEKRSLHKEEEMAYELSEVKRMAEMEKRILQEKNNLLLEQKNTQIKAFRSQLDDLLSSIAILPATS